MQTPYRGLIVSGLLSLALAGLLQSQPAFAQSTQASQVSAISMAPSVEGTALVLEALPAGSKLVVTALRPVGDLVELSVETASQGAAISLRVSAATARATGLAVGTTLVVTAISAGMLISAGGETVAFIPDALSRSLIHHREL